MPGVTSRGSAGQVTAESVPFLLSLLRHSRSESTVDALIGSWDNEWTISRHLAQFLDRLVLDTRAWIRRPPHEPQATR